MRRYTAETRTAFRNGLRRENQSPYNAPVLTDAYNCRVTDIGLRAPIFPINPFAGSYTFDWPFPQLIRGMQVTLLCYESAIYVVNESVTPWTATQIVTYDADNLTVPKAIAANGGPWELIDLGVSFVLLNETNTIYRAPRTITDHTDATKYVLRTDRPLLTGCMHQGRAWLAGFDWDAGWGNVINTWLSGLPVEMDKDLMFNSGMVLHTSVGAGELWGLLGDVELAHEGWVPEDISGQDALRSHFMDKLMSNAIGWKPVMWQGAVLRLLPLGASVVAYGEGGVSLLSADGSERILLRVGVMDRGAAGGNEYQHVFVDNSGVLWRIESNSGLVRLGYQEYFESMTAPLAVTYNSTQREYFISDGISTFVLTEQGLSECGRAVSSGTWVTGGFVGVTFDLADLDAGRFEAVTEGFDFEASGNQQRPFDPRGMKIITEVQVGMRSDRRGAFSQAFSRAFDRIGGYGEVAIDYRLIGNDTWIRSAWKKLNAQGWARVNVSGNEFRVALRTPDYEGIYCDYVQVEYIKR